MKLNFAVHWRLISPRLWRRLVTKITLQQVQVFLSVLGSNSCHPTGTFLEASASSIIHPRHCREIRKATVLFTSLTLYCPRVWPCLNKPCLRRPASKWKSKGSCGCRGWRMTGTLLVLWGLLSGGEEWLWTWTLEFTVSVQYLLYWHLYWRDYSNYHWQGNKNLAQCGEIKKKKVLLASE